MNKVVLIGRMTRDPELSHTPSGVACCRFTLAVNRNFRNANGENEADFINIQTWRGAAENCAKYLRKGDRVGIVGRLQITNTEGKDGVKRYYVDVVAEEVEFLSERKQDAEQPVSPQPPKPAPKPEQTRMGMLMPAPDDLPF